GTAEMRRNVAATASEWTREASLKFDFGRDQPTQGGFYEWDDHTPSDSVQIRISFDQPGGWSTVGTDSIMTPTQTPNIESNYFKGHPGELRFVILHEFGHALGVPHVFKHPDADVDFRFGDDVGYKLSTDQFGQRIPDAQQRRPGLYTELAGPPMNWSREVVDA